MKIDPSTVNLPFQVTIPQGCPPSFRNDIERIMYTLSGNVSSQVSEYKIKTPLVISALIDPNQQPNLLQAVDQSATKNVTICCCFNTGEAQLSLKMPKSGFCVVQEYLPITCRNGSSQQITVRVEVVQSISYNARGTHRGISEPIIGKFSCQVQPSGSDTKSVDFDLPPSIILGFTIYSNSHHFSFCKPVDKSFLGIVWWSIYNASNLSSSCDW